MLPSGLKKSVIILRIVSFPLCFYCFVFLSAPPVICCIRLLWEIKISPAEVDENLKKFKNARLKPQQKVFLLRTMLVPAFYHRLVLGRLHAGYLCKFDLKVRGVLHLPHDFPNPAFYTTMKDGGLGIPYKRYSIPVMARRRLSDNSGRTNHLCQTGNVFVEK